MVWNGLGWADLGLTHVLTHTGLSAVGFSSRQWTLGVREMPENGAKLRINALKVDLTAAHNPEVVGSSPASATKICPKSTRIWDFFFAF